MYVLLSEFVYGNRSIYSDFYVKKYKKPPVHGAVYVYSGRPGGVFYSGLSNSKWEVEAFATAGATPSLLLATWGVKYDS
jgi:hypothetical protein